MKRFKNILYILDEFSLQQHAGADKVAGLARLNGARVTAMIASDISLFDNLSLKLSGRFDEVLQAVNQQNRQSLDAFLKDRRWRDITVTPHYDSATDFISIIRTVLREKFDLVIKEASLSDGIDQLAMRLVRKCPCPVWIVKYGAGDFRRILAAVDVGAQHPETAALNKKIVELAHSLAQREGGEAHYIHSWQLEYESMLSSPRFNVSAEEIMEMKRSLLEERRSALFDLLISNNIDYQDTHVHLREGSSDDVINKIIEDLRIDVAVMGSVARSGIPGLLIGNRAEKLLNTINCTVLTVKPDGFRSPVTLGPGS